LGSRGHRNSAPLVNSDHPLPCGLAKLGRTGPSCTGRVRPGDLLVVPQARQTLEALQDSAILLIVAKHLERSDRLGSPVA